MAVFGADAGLAGVMLRFSGVAVTRG